MTQPGRVVLGRVAGAHGVHGQIRVRYFGDGPHHLLELTQLWLAEHENGDGARRFEVVRAGTGRGGEARLALAGIESREAAVELRGHFVLADPAQLEALPEGEYYWYQLIGCRVEDRQGRPIGTVREIWETGAHDVLVVESEDGQRHLLSTARELMPEIDLAAGRVVIEEMSGLVEPDHEHGETS